MSGPRDLEHTFTGAGTVRHGISGRYMRVLEAPSGPVYIRLDGGSELKRVAGQSIGLASPFSSIAIRSAVAQTVLFTISDTPQDDNQTAITATINATITAGDTITTTADVSVAGVTASQVLAGRADRVSVIVKNLSGNSDPIRVGESGTGAARGHELMPGESISLDVTAAIYVYNSKATAQSVSIIEIRDV